MNFTIHVNEDDFIHYNPWLPLHVDRKLNRFLYSSDLKSVIISQIRDQYPSLFRQHLESESEYKKLITKLNLEADKGILRLGQTTERKIKELVENPNELINLKTSISSALITDFSKYQKEIDRKLERMENNTNNKIFFSFCIGLLFSASIYSLF